MKTLKLDHENAVQQLGEKTGVTWRLFDDKDIQVNDTLLLIDMVSGNPESWQTIGRAVIEQIIEKRLADTTDKEIIASRLFKSRDDMFARMRDYYGADVAWNTPVKIISYTFAPASEQDSGQTIEPGFPNEVRLYTDGGSRGNPGPSAAGYVVFGEQESEPIFKEGVYLGITTNNQAEYLALKLGLETCLARGARTVHVHMDSLLVVNQMNRTFKIKNRELWPIHESIKDLIPKFKKVSFVHVPRTLNKAADDMVNQALDDEPV